MTGKKIVCAPALPLPNKMPNKKAIRSDTQYLPEMWEFEYSVSEYLSSLSDDDLYKRHQALIKNMRALTSSDRHIIPIEAGFLSSWYWYRKEHQTRCEMAKRNLPMPQFIVGIPIEQPTNHSVAVKPIHPNAGNVLYRFTEAQYAEKLLKQGSLYLKCASEMVEHEGHEARYDVETEKSYITLGKYTKITTLDGRPINFIGDVRYTTTLPDYYLYCMSADYDETLLNEFGGACVLIKSPREFSARLKEWGKKNLSGWDFFDLPVKYYDPYELIGRQHIDAGLSKRIEFAYQREFRFLFLPPAGGKAQKIPPIEIGSIEDIAEVIS